MLGIGRLVSQFPTLQFSIHLCSSVADISYLKVGFASVCFYFMVSKAYFGYLARYDMFQYVSVL